jgi:hypothetical protein
MRTFLPHHRQPTSSRAVAAAGLSFFIFLMIGAGCASYSAPGKSADFRAMGITAVQASALTDRDIAHRLDRKPLAGFPASVAVVRVQAP